MNLADIPPQLNYTNAAQFRAAGYQAMTVNGTQYGETRSYGNFSFTRVYGSGHEGAFICEAHTNLDD